MLIRGVLGFGICLHVGFGLGRYLFKKRGFWRLWTRGYTDSEREGKRRERKKNIMNGHVHPCAMHAPMRTTSSVNDGSVNKKPQTQVTFPSLLLLHLASAQSDSSPLLSHRCYIIASRNMQHRRPGLEFPPPKKVQTVQNLAQAICVRGGTCKRVARAPDYCFFACEKGSKS